MLEEGGGSEKAFTGICEQMVCKISFKYYSILNIIASKWFPNIPFKFNSILIKYQILLRANGL